MTSCHHNTQVPQRIFKARTKKCSHTDTYNWSLFAEKCCPKCREPLNFTDLLNKCFPLWKLFQLTLNIKSKYLSFLFCICRFISISSKFNVSFELKLSAKEGYRLKYVLKEQLDSHIVSIYLQWFNVSPFCSDEQVCTLTYQYID